jgi:hypothetical protein
LEVINSSETPVLAWATLRNIPEDGILHSHRRENLKSYKFILVLKLSTDVVIVCVLTWRSWLYGMSFYCYE